MNCHQLLNHLHPEDSVLHRQGPLCSIGATSLIRGVAPVPWHAGMDSRLACEFYTRLRLQAVARRR